MASHTLYIPDADEHAGEIIISGEEARHAVRVKRVREGEGVTIVDGAGLLLLGVVSAAKRELVIRVSGSERVPRAAPCIEVCSAAPKGPRVSDLIDGLSQVGASVWRPLRCERSVTSAGEKKLDRLHRVAIESAKQSGRAWLLEFAEETTLESALREPADLFVMAHGGERAMEVVDCCPAGKIVLFVGPEGGFTDREIALAREGGALLASFGAHTMRIEAAAVAATAITMHLARIGEGSCD